MSAHITTGMLRWTAHSPSLFDSENVPHLSLIYLPERRGWFVCRDDVPVHRFAFKSRAQVIEFLETFFTTHGVPQ